MNRIQALAFVIPMLLTACSARSGGSSDQATTTSTALATIAPVSVDAGADAESDAGADASTDGGDDAGRPKRYVNPVAEAYRAKCCAPRAEKQPGYVSGCEAGKADQCAAAVEAFKKGCGAPLDLEKAASLEDRACALGHEPSCTARSMSDLGESRDNNDMLASLCAKSPLTGCYELAERTPLYLGEESARRAFALYKRACDAGVGRACFRLGDIGWDIAWRINSPYPKREEVLDYYVRGCKADIAYCYTETENRLHGEWSKRDNSDILPRLAPILLAGHEKLCQDECDCQHERVARWVAKYEPVRARAYAEEVCKAQGHWNCGVLGELLEKGVGGPADVPRAVEIYKAVCPYDKDACDNLAAMYEEGRGVDKDPEAARKMAEEACPFEKDFQYPTATLLPQSSVRGPLAGCARVARYREEGFGGEVNLKGAYQVYYYWCGTTEGVSLCPNRIKLGRRLGYP